MFFFILEHLKDVANVANGTITLLDDASDCVIRNESNSLWHNIDFK